MSHLETVVVEIHCAFCGEPGEAVVDPSAARSQRYVEDCWVCCRPNLLVITVDGDGSVAVRTEQE